MHRRIIKNQFAFFGTYTDGRRTEAEEVTLLKTAAVDTLRHRQLSQDALLSLESAEEEQIDATEKKCKKFINQKLATDQLGFAKRLCDQSKKTI